MTASNFAACLNVTLKYEGGRANNRNDPGGKTNQGITQRTYNAYRERVGAHRPADVYVMVPAERDAIYRTQYWDSVQGDLLPAGVDMAAFDYAVNSGPVRAVKALQFAIGTDADGHFGLMTEQAIRNISN